jgi:hypothetical protein
MNLDSHPAGKEHLVSNVLLEDHPRVPRKQYRKQCSRARRSDKCHRLPDPAQKSPPFLLEIKNLVKNSTKQKKNVSIKDVIKLVSEFYNVDEESVYDKTRKKEVVKPRQVIMYILREDLSVSFPSIGEKMGGRDHTTVIHSCEKVKEEIKTNPILDGRDRPDSSALKRCDNL